MDLENVFQLILKYIKLLNCLWASFLNCLTFKLNYGFLPIYKKKNKNFRVFRIFICCKNYKKKLEKKKYNFLFAQLIFTCSRLYPLIFLFVLLRYKIF
jgi:hypothetical protein